MKKGIITTVEITSTHIKLLQARIQRSKPSLSLCSIKEIDNEQQPRAAELLSKMLPAKIAADQHVIAILPRRSAILKQLSLPSHADEEIRRMVSLQIVNQIPYPREDIVYDYCVLKKDPSGYTKVLVVAVPKAEINKHLEVFNKSGMHIQKFVLSSFGMIDWLLYQLKILKQESKESTALINIDYNQSEVCFFQEGNLLFSRSINFGAKDLGPDGLKGYLEQVGLTFGTFKKDQMGGKIAKIVLVSSSNNLEALKARLEEYYPVAVDIIAPLNGFPQDKSFAVPAQEGKGLVSLTANLGVLFSDYHNKIDLMPREVMDTKRSRIRKRAFIQMVSMLIITLGLTVSVFGIRNFKKKNYLEGMQSKVATMERKAQIAEQKIEFLRFVKDKMQNRLLIVDVMKELYELTPQEISFRTLQIDQRGGIMIQGAADASPRVNQFQNELVNSSLFQDVSLEYATQRKRFKQEYTDFKIICRLAQ